MFLNVIAVIAGLALLVWGADRFVTGSAATARNLGVSPMLIGLTVVGLGTSAPEILVSVVASSQGDAGLAIGNAVGSNIANIALILGSTALIAPLQVQSESLRREYPILLAVTLVTLLLMVDGALGRLDGLVLLAGLVLVLVGMVRIGIRERNADPMRAEYAAEIPEHMRPALAALWVGLGLAALLGGSRLLVWGATNLASAFGVSDLVIGLTVVAVGTSLPELAAAVAAALKQEHDIAIGNVIGSNIFNLLAVLAVPALLAPGPFDPAVLTRDMPVMIGLTLVLFVMSYGFKGDGRISRAEGLLLLAAFVAYQSLLFLRPEGVVFR
jgi:cation:H+ antiporter